jgi:hypothetical protein
MSTKPTARRVRSTYEFIKAHRHKHSVQVMCRLLASPRGAATRGSHSLCFARIRTAGVRS